MKTKYPDYDKSILSVTSSVLKYYGAETHHPTLAEFDKLLENKPKNVVVLLFDGLGSSNLRSLGEDSYLNTHKVTDISSVFPPTTVAATTTMQTGLSPYEHSWLGWTLYFDEIKDTVTVFRNKKSDGSRIKEYNVASKFIPYESIFKKIAKANDGVKTHYLSLFFGERVFCVRHAVKKIERIIKSEGEQFVYMYWYQPDHAMHTYGINSEKVRKIVKNIDKNVAKLAEKMKDTVLVTIADHGLIDGKWESLDDYPEVQNLLVRAPSIEPRALAMFVKDGKKEEFSQKFNECFHDKFLLVTKEQALSDGLLGSGVVGKKTADFLGDFLAIAISDTCLSMHGKPKMIGAHAGLTEEEMTVPFIAVAK